MNIEQAMKQMLDLKDGEFRKVYTSQDGTAITVLHTGKHSARDFAVGLEIPKQKHFKPTHIRLIVDVFLKRTSNPKSAEQLLGLLERLFNGEDVTVLATEALKLEFPMKFDSAETNLYYSQLLFVEQDINYGPTSKKPSKMKLPRNFLMSFIRFAMSGDQEIDKVVFLAVRNLPPPKKYHLPIAIDGGSLV
jgi:hypothetical protein